MSVRITSGRPSAPFWRRWSEGWLNLRNRLIADARFQAWASASPVTRVIARRRARALFDICAGFVYTQVLLACVRLRVCESLSEGPLDCETLSDRMRLPPDAALRLLRAAASLDLLRELPDGRFALADLGASMLGNPWIADFVEHHTLLYDDLRDPVALLRGETATRMSRYWPYSKNGPGQNGAAQDDAPAPDQEAVARYSALMTRSQILVSQDILDAYSLESHSCLLDVGGGEGRFLAAAAARNPGLRLMLFDLPQVAARAEDFLSAAGVRERAIVHGGDFLNEPLPAGADILSLVRIVHDHDDVSARALLRAAHAALPKGGTLLIAEPMAARTPPSPVGDAYFGFYLLSMGRGRARTFDELAALLRESGFEAIRNIPTRRPLITSLIAARRTI